MQPLTGKGTNCHENVASEGMQVGADPGQTLMDQLSLITSRKALCVGWPPGWCSSGVDTSLLHNRNHPFHRPNRALQVSQILAVHLPLCLAWSNWAESLSERQVQGHMERYTGPRQRGTSPVLTSWTLPAWTPPAWRPAYRGSSLMSAQINWCKYGFKHNCAPFLWSPACVVFVYGF